MELNELKHIWNKHAAEAIENQQRSPNELRRIIQRRTQTAIQKITHHILVEVGITFLLMTLAIAFFYRENGTFVSIETLSAVCYMIISFLFYRFNYQEVKRIIYDEKNLKKNLQNIVRFMSIITKSYYVLAFMVTPIIGGIFFMYGINKGAEMTGGSFAGISGIQWIIIAVVLTLYLGFAIWGSKWYVHRLYGMHYKSLKQCLRELEEENS